MPKSKVDNTPNGEDSTPKAEDKPHKGDHRKGEHKSRHKKSKTMINQIPVPGEAALWNYQDYVLEIWDAVLGMGAIGEITWQAGRDDLMLYYGPVQNDQDENVEEEEERADEVGQARQYQSAEFVYDSGSD
ncbi:hypothetical protein AK830_g981 [Neonectria ditissima]|uniref:Uncharacterized protein n=1 Tax=Neonectria ditissima TaxID=78410 RepID=A0A0P7BVR9_9HYPO|nr:hypothetical protein AK830_g981 [Neonectria ditissima]